MSTNTPVFLAFADFNMSAMTEFRFVGEWPISDEVVAENSGLGLSDKRNINH